MATLREQLTTLSNDDALRLVARVRQPLLDQVATLRNEHLKGVSELSDKSRDSYRADALRVAAARGDLLSLAGTAASFRKLRAACIWKAREDLKETLQRADRARKKTGFELAALCVYDEELGPIQERLSMLASLKFDPERAVRREKTHNQRQKLGRVPDDWVRRIHERTQLGKYGRAVAVAAVIPVRPAEIAERVRVQLLDDGSLLFEVKGAKCKDEGVGVAKGVKGIGQPLRRLKVARVDSSRREVFEFLKAACRDNGGSISVGKGLTASGISNAFRAASALEFDNMASPPSFYALRHAGSAELKSAGLSKQEVAKGMGHASERSQKAYGTRGQGSGGMQVQTWASDPVRSQKPSHGPPSVARRSTHLGSQGAGMPKSAPQPRR